MILRVDRFIVVPVKGGLQKIYVNRIYYVECQGHNLIFHTSEGDLVSSGTMKETEEELKGVDFWIDSKAMLINLEHVDGIREGSAVVNGELLTISRSRKNSFMENLANYMSEVMK